MTKSFVSLLFLLLTLLLTFTSGEKMKFANGQETVKQKTWCVAKASASEVELNSNIEYACNWMGDCSMIQPGGSCYNPDTVISHASAVMNQYYAMTGRNTWDCYFSDSGLITVNDPSYGSCKYA